MKTKYKLGAATILAILGSFIFGGNILFWFIGIGIAMFAFRIVLTIVVAIFIFLLVYVFIFGLFFLIIAL